MIEWLKKLFGRSKPKSKLECIYCCWWIHGKHTKDGISRCGKTGRQKRINEYCDCEENN